MTLRTLAAGTLVAVALAAAGCGGDDEDERGSGSEPTTKRTAVGGKLTDVEPRANKPNIVGSEDQSTAELIESVGRDAVGYWEAVFKASDLPYRRPRVVAVEQAGDDGCGGRYEPVREFFHLCSGPDGAQLSLGVRMLDLLKAVGGGDGSIAFLVGFGVAMDANDQLTGGGLAQGKQPDDLFKRRSACFTGAWLRNLRDRDLLEAGDPQEVYDMSRDYVPAGSGEERRKLLALGFDEGAAACQEKVGEATLQSAEGGSLEKDLPPRRSAPNVQGGDAPITRFVGDYAGDAVAYWRGVFGQNDLRYSEPRVAVLEQGGDSGCGKPFDPGADPYFVCAGKTGSSIVFGAGALEQARADFGDSAAAFLAGYGVALDTLDQLTGQPLANGKPVDDSFVHGAVCLTGAWIRNLATRQLVDAADNQELLQVAERFVPGKTELGVSLGQDLLALGVARGPAPCLREVKR